MTAVLYAIADCEPAAVPARTATGLALRTVGEGPVAILGPEDSAPARRPTDPGRIACEHERTLSELMALPALLPARYGTCVTPDSAAALVRERREELAAALHRVRDAVEIGLTVRLAASHPAVPVEGRPGTAYLRARVARREQEARAAELLAPLATIARATTSTPAPGPQRREPGELRVAYLVSRARVAEFVSELGELDARHPDLELVATGPWPPYSFAGDVR